MAKLTKEILHPAEQYARDVINGKIVACKWVRLACERHVHDLKHAHKRGLYFDPDAAEYVLRFISMLRHSKGKWGRGQGELIRLEPWQQFIIWVAFGWKRADGMRRFRMLYEEVARKNGKSTKAAGLGLLLAFADGEPGAEVYCLHPSMKILYDDLTWKPIGEAQIGDQLIAFDENASDGRGRYRKARVSTILGIRRSFTTAYKIHFENGHSVICSGNHKWLSKSPNGSNLHWRTTNDLRSGFNIRFFGLPCHHEIWEGHALNRSGAHLRITSIEPMDEQELIDIETSTGTFIAEGLFSHNSAATKRDQARIVHKEAIRMVRKNSGLRKFIKIYKDNLNLDRTASKYEPLGADSDSTDGLNVHGIIADELHAWKSREMWDVLETATGSREQPMLIAITTAGMDRRSVCYEKHEYTRKVLEGWKDGSFEDDTWFGIIYTLDEGDDWRNEKVWIKANPNLGVSKYIEDMRMKAKRATQMAAALNNFLRRELNVWVQGEVKWMNMEAWRACGGDIPALELPKRLKGMTAYGGLDLSSTLDITAFLLVFVDEDGEVYVVCRCWIPEDNMLIRTRDDGVHYKQWVDQGYIEATPGSVIDYDWIFEQIEKDMDRFDVDQIAFDRWGASRVVQVLENKGATMVQFGQGFASMSAPMKELERLVHSKKIHHGNNPVLTWMADNLVARLDPAGNIKPDKEKSREKIDGIVALIMAIDLALRHPEKKSVYEKRGIRTLG